MDGMRAPNSRQREPQSKPTSLFCVAQITLCIAHGLYISNTHTTYTLFVTVMSSSQMADSKSAGTAVKLNSEIVLSIWEKYKPRISFKKIKSHDDVSVTCHLLQQADLTAGAQLASTNEAGHPPVPTPNGNRKPCLTLLSIQPIQFLIIKKTARMELN